MLISFSRLSPGYDIDGKTSIYLEVNLEFHVKVVSCQHHAVETTLPRPRRAQSYIRWLRLAGTRLPS
jgi:hypothetical protein